MSWEMLLRATLATSQSWIFHSYFNGVQISTEGIRDNVSEPWVRASTWVIRRLMETRYEEHELKSQLRNHSWGMKIAASWMYHDPWAWRDLVPKGMLSVLGSPGPGISRHQMFSTADCQLCCPGATSVWRTRLKHRLVGAHLLQTLILTVWPHSFTFPITGKSWTPWTLLLGDLFLFQAAMQASPPLRGCPCLEGAAPQGDCYGSPLLHPSVPGHASGCAPEEIFLPSPELQVLPFGFAFVFIFAYVFFLCSIVMITFPALLCFKSFCAWITWATKTWGIFTLWSVHAPGRNCPQVHLSQRGGCEPHCNSQTLRLSDAKPALKELKGCGARSRQ